MKKYRSFESLGIGCILGIIIYGISFIIGCFTWPYLINEWLIFLKKSPTVIWWQGGLISLIPGLGYVGLVLAVLTWIIMLFIK